VKKQLKNGLERFINWDLKLNRINKPMKSIIIYESLHGSTEKCAMLLSEILNSDTQINRLKEMDNVQLNDFDVVIIGGSIHNGLIQLRIEEFIQKNNFQLLEKPLGLYLCCMEEGETARMQFERAFPSELREKAIATGLFGGEFNLKKMGFFEKRFIRKLTGIRSSISKIDADAIWAFAEKINKVIS
jgi:menaquinone-dependent protoporphyrinogen oxidase